MKTKKEQIQSPNFEIEKPLFQNKFFKKMNATFLFVLLVLGLHAQDLHFSNYRNISSFFNPAQTGDFLGTYKMQGAVRSQYDKTYQQSMIGGQINFESPASPMHWISCGINVMYDQAGSLKQSAKGIGIALAYHVIATDKSFVALGISGQQISLGADTKFYKSENSILNKPDPDFNLLKDFNPSLLTFATGIHYKQVVSKKSALMTGIAFTHINTPGFTFAGGKTTSTYGNRINFNVNFKTKVSKMITLEPATYLSFSESQTNINLQLLSEWAIKKDAAWKGVLGLSNRASESIAFLAGYTSSRLSVTASYDMLYNSLQNPLNKFGAIELGAYYVIVAKDRSKRKAEAVCPRL